MRHLQLESIYPRGLEKRRLTMTEIWTNSEYHVCRRLQ